MVRHFAFLVLLSLLALVAGCENKPSEELALEALRDAFSEVGKIESVKKLNGWFEDESKNKYTMEVEYVIKFNKEFITELNKARGSITALLLMPIYNTCFSGENKKLMKEESKCKSQAKITFRKTDKGWKMISEESELWK